MPLAINTAFSVGLDGKPVAAVTVGGIIYNTRDMDHAIGLLMKARGDLTEPPPGLESEEIQKAVATIKDELAKAGMGVTAASPGR